MLIAQIESATMVGDDRAAVLRALAECKHHRRLGYRMTLIAAIDVHRSAPNVAYTDYQADAVDVLRFVYRHQLEWPIGIYEPPPSRVTGRLMGLCSQVKLASGDLVGAQDERGEPVWRRWDGSVPAPLSGQCCV